MKISSDDVRELLREACEKAGSRRQWALAHGLSPAYVGDVLLGRRLPGPAICAKFDLVGETTYRKVS